MFTRDTLCKHVSHLTPPHSFTNACLLGATARTRCTHITLCESQLESALLGLLVLVRTGSHSNNMCQSNAHLPCLQLGPSVPELVALVQGSDDGEAQLSREYGGSGGDGFQGGAVPLYIAIGNVRLSDVTLLLKMPAVHRHRQSGRVLWGGVPPAWACDCNLSHESSPD